MPRRKNVTPMYFTSVELENVRCFGDRQQLRLTNNTGQPSRWTLILGENGVGKTTLLQCLGWMRLEPRARDIRENLSLVEGELIPGLLDESDNKILESLLRSKSADILDLKVSMSVDIELSSFKAEKRRATTGGNNISSGVTLSFHNGHLEEVTVTKKPQIGTSLGGHFPDPLIVAYGANRQLGERNLNSTSLDDPISSARLSRQTDLYDMKEILGLLDYASSKKTGKHSREFEQRNRLANALERLLPLDSRAGRLSFLPPDILNQSRGPSGVCLDTFSGLIPISSLSLGYQTTLAWTADLSWRLLKRYSSSLNPLAEPAVVLIDEIDLHLHPQWQLTIIDSLSAIFPRTQFIATSHSPLIVQTAEDANIVLLRTRDREVEIVNDPEIVRQWRVDQILMSDLFGLRQARSYRTELMFKRHDQLEDKKSRTRKEERELQLLRTQIAQIPTESDPSNQKVIDYLSEVADVLKRHGIAGTK